MISLTEPEKRQRESLAAEMFLTMTPKQINEWLTAQQDNDYRQDMRDRFNQLRELRNQQHAKFKHH